MVRREANLITLAVTVMIYALLVVFMLSMTGSDVAVLLGL